jgi:hypothetical protein
MHEMLVWFAWRWKGRRYKCDPARRIRFGYGTLTELYYRWKENGRTPAALALRYPCANRKLSARHVAELSKLCLAPETMSLSEAWRKLPARVATKSAYYYAIPKRLRAALARLLAHRRRGQTLERAARQHLEGLGR